jgi:hypothetical protein
MILSGQTGAWGYHLQLPQILAVRADKRRNREQTGFANVFFQILQFIEQAFESGIRRRF